MDAVIGQHLRQPFAAQPLLCETAPEIEILPTTAEMIVAADNRPGFLRDEGHRVNVVAGDKVLWIVRLVAHQGGGGPEMLDRRIDVGSGRFLDRR